MEVAMHRKALENLVIIGSLKPEPPNDQEIRGLIESGRKRLTDTQLPALSLESRFDLGYNATHALALAALRQMGFRSENRFTVFQCLAHTAGLSPIQIRILSDAHNRRNKSEYDGSFDMNESLVESLIRTAIQLLELLDGPNTLPKKGR